ncbi:uncharacterized protein NECHADRAFT_101132 [Fusarium vanettenii 77-13-4]|uniref:Infection structure specific protein n=1 Tax=Fusarium vanettenii (strain ATCC MYA-4622 / CBS 123669 / FGSC 9596 / NRRL 45880 / 77-13-4) TaxID=660122 RepID=C7ZAT8_FUSV7|nr:uncharacterized protein NECHADRAFT_101132 [Fusarium vanettenii 77-13-4]EEU38765.1 hypothetical protein NECHADRAFT_101132 [Fusarium vanettenii 77-13-4]
MCITQILLIIANGLPLVVAQTPATPMRPSGPISPYQTPCQRVLSSVVAKMTGAPAPDVAISELAVSFAIGEYHNTQDPCQLPVVTGSAAEVFSEWASSWTSWQSKNIPGYREIWTACSKENLVGDIVPVGTNVCSKLAAAITQDDDKDKDKDKTETTSKTAGGSEETSTQAEETSKRTGAQSVATTTEGDSPGSRQTGSLGMVGVVAGMVVAGLY